jgi:hypothetical protein
LEYRPVSVRRMSLHRVAVSNPHCFSNLQLVAARRIYLCRTSNPKVAGSRPARPIESSVGGDLGSAECAVDGDLVESVGENREFAIVELREE